MDYALMSEQLDMKALIKQFEKKEQVSAIRQSGGIVTEYPQGYTAKTPNGAKIIDSVDLSNGGGSITFNKPQSRAQVLCDAIAVFRQEKLPPVTEVIARYKDAKGVTIGMAYHTKPQSVLKNILKKFHL